MTITISNNELKAIFEDNDVVRLEYPADEFPTPQTKIIMIFSQQSGKKPRYLELQEWLDLLEDYVESQPSIVQDGNVNITKSEHGKEFICVVTFRVDGDNDKVGKVVVPQEQRDDCINAILEKYPHELLDFSTKLWCKKCFEESLIEQSAEESEFGQIVSRTIH